MSECGAPSNDYTVLECYTKAAKTSADYQSEAALEASLIETLTGEGYERAVIHTEKELVANLKAQLERLNGIVFSSSEWSAFFADSIAKEGAGIADKAFTIQSDCIKLLQRDDGTQCNIKLIDKKNIYNNTLQVINQYQEREAQGGKQNARYDVTILVNGLPLVHLELKRRSVALEEAFNQIARYQEQSFGAGSALFEYVQIFVISNGTNTKYYSNTTRSGAVKENSTAQSGVKKAMRSFKFTSYWADAENHRICDIEDFARTFLSPRTLLNVLINYCVLTSDRTLMVMRPYQIAAAERIIRRIRESEEKKTYSTTDGGGYIWHTTGSGKTLTSFKTAVAASQMECVDFVLFVVDRKDLDYQTMKEYDKFEEGAANSTLSTKDLSEQLSHPRGKILITTIQKLFIFAKKYTRHEVFGKRVVMIFDECHRSQGSMSGMHKLITEHFKHYHAFGFTGTPILPQTANLTGRNMTLTTEQVFGKRLHMYSIVDAIDDKNVLPFRVEYNRTVQHTEDGDKVPLADSTRVMMDDRRITEVVRYIVEHFNQKTMRQAESYTFNRLVNVDEVALVLGKGAKNKEAGAPAEQRQKVNIRGFNSILAVSSIDAAIKYYNEFKAQQQAAKDNRLKIAMIYSYSASDGGADENGTFTDDENNENTAGLDSEAKKALDKSIADYNEMFGTNYDTSAEKFQNYYKDVSLRMKNMEVDLLIVVNMFLTGFDAPALNTLWVDKNLKYHGLLQAYSRTNRILNSVKSFGNIVSFRDLDAATDEALALFGTKDARGRALLKSFEEYYNGYDEMYEPKASGNAEAVAPKLLHKEGYKEVVEKLLNEYPVEKKIEGGEAQRDFVNTVSKFLQLSNILGQFDEFKGNEILTQRQVQDYKSKYIDIHDEFVKESNAGGGNTGGKDGGTDKGSALDSVVFELELIKQVEIDVDYILRLIKEHKGSKEELLADIRRALGATVSHRAKTPLLEAFALAADRDGDIKKQFSDFVQRQSKADLKSIIERERLDEQKTHTLMDKSFRDRRFYDWGEGISGLLPPISRFGASGNKREEKKLCVTKLLKGYFDVYCDLITL